MTQDERVVNSCRGQHTSSVVVVLTSVATIKVDDLVSDHSIVAIVRHSYRTTSVVREQKKKE